MTRATCHVPEQLLCLLYPVTQELGRGVMFNSLMVTSTGTGGWGKHGDICTMLHLKLRCWNPQQITIQFLLIWIIYSPGSSSPRSCFSDYILQMKMRRQCSHNFTSAGCPCLPSWRPLVHRAVSRCGSRWLLNTLWSEHLVQPSSAVHGSVHCTHSPGHRIVVFNVMIQCRP